VRQVSASEVIAAGAVAVYGEQSMGAITTIGLDIAKSVFQVHGVDGWQRRCPSATEAPECSGVLSEDAAVPGRDRGLRATSHHWSREIAALGHTVSADAAGT
jgi:transposase